MRFLVDTQIPLALAGWLRIHGHQAEHVLEIGLAQSKDALIWRYAQEHSAAVITKDEDFAEWVRRGRSGPAVVWLRIGNCSNPVLQAWLEGLLPAIVRQLEQGERLIEVY
jgi:predicted nuclease of predicted toxin-antitoxin system